MADYVLDAGGGSQTGGTFSPTPGDIWTSGGGSQTGGTFSPTPGDIWTSGGGSQTGGTFSPAINPPVPPSPSAPGGARGFRVTFSEVYEMSRTRFIPKTTAVSLWVDAIAADAQSFDIAGGVELRLYKAAFTPAPDLDPTTLTEADFDGYGAIDTSGGAVTKLIDPATGQYGLMLTAGGTGFNFVTTGLTNLPQTIYGFGLWTVEVTPKFLGSALLVEPVELQVVGDVVPLDPMFLLAPFGMLN